MTGVVVYRDIAKDTYPTATRWEFGPHDVLNILKDNDGDTTVIASYAANAWAFVRPTDGNGEATP